MVKVVGGRGKEFGVSFEGGGGGGGDPKLQNAGDGGSKFWAFWDDELLRVPISFILFC